MESICLMSLITHEVPGIQVDDVDTIQSLQCHVGS